MRLKMEFHKNDYYWVVGMNSLSNISSYSGVLKPWRAMWHFQSSKWLSCCHELFQAQIPSNSGAISICAMSILHIVTAFQLFFLHLLSYRIDVCLYMFIDRHNIHIYVYLTAMILWTRLTATTLLFSIMHWGTEAQRCHLFGGKIGA